MPSDVEPTQIIEIEIEGKNKKQKQPANKFSLGMKMEPEQSCPGSEGRLGVHGILNAGRNGLATQNFIISKPSSPNRTDGDFHRDKGGKKRVFNPQIHTRELLKSELQKEEKPPRRKA